MDVTKDEAKSEDAIELWFFRDLSDDQRSGLIYLVLGDKIAGEATNYGLQRVCLKRIIQQIREAALTTAQSEAAAKDALLLECREKLGDIVMGEGLHPDEAVELHAKITATLTSGPTT